MTTRTKIIIAVIALLVVGGAAYWYFSKDKEKPGEDAPDKPAPKTPEPKTVMARESSGYPNTSATMQDIPVISKVAPRSEPVSFVKVAQNPPPRTMAPSAGISVTKDGTTVAPSKVVKLSSTSPKGGKIV
jgi:hypothetical protein